MFRKLFMHRSVRFYMELACGLLALISAPIFFGIERGIGGSNLQFDDTSYLTLIFMLVGGAISILDAFFPLPFVGILPCIAYGYSIGNHIKNMCFPLADVSEPVAFFTGSADKASAMLGAFIPFLILFLLIAIAASISCFLGEKKANVEQSC